MRGWIGLAMVGVCLVLAGCASLSSSTHKGWYIMRWVDRAPSTGPSAAARREDVVRFERVTAYDKKEGGAAFSKAAAQLREGDLLAFRMSHAEAGKKMAAGGVGKICYEVLEFGHLAILVQNPGNPTNAADLRVFSSESFRGPNIREDVETLRTQCWDVYRLDQWARVDAARLREFVVLSMVKAGRWYGYDFSGIVGLRNSNMKPGRSDEIGQEYICSTVVVAALHYAGVELDAVQRGGVFDIVTPKQVVESKGRLIPAPAGTLEVDAGPGGVPDGAGSATSAPPPNK